MPVTTDKITETLARRVGEARHMVDTRVVPYAIPATRKAAEQAAQQAEEAARQLRQIVQEKLAPMASAAFDNAMVASAPARREAARRGRLAAAVLRGTDVIAMRKRRRWPVALGCLLLGSAIGAAAAWLSQAGKPVQLTPYPLTADSQPPQPPTSLDLTEDADHPA